MSLHDTDLGLTKREMAKGLTIEGKLERKYPQFKRMKAIFGEKSNIKPAGTIELNVPAVLSKCEDDEDSDRANSEQQNSGAPRNDSDIDSDASTDFGEDILRMQSDFSFHNTVCDEDRYVQAN